MFDSSNSNLKYELSGWENIYSYHKSKFRMFYNQKPGILEYEIPPHNGIRSNFLSKFIIIDNIQGIIAQTTSCIIYYDKIWKIIAYFKCIEYMYTKDGSLYLLERKTYINKDNIEMEMIILYKFEFKKRFDMKRTILYNNININTHFAKINKENNIIFITLPGSNIISFNEDNWINDIPEIEIKIDSSMTIDVNMFHYSFKKQKKIFKEALKKYDYPIEDTKLLSSVDRYQIAETTEGFIVIDILKMESQKLVFWENQKHRNISFGYYYSGIISIYKKNEKLLLQIYDYS
jgi:hypothetical protein